MQWPSLRKLRLKDHGEIPVFCVVVEGIMVVDVVIVVLAVAATDDVAEGVVIMYVAEDTDIDVVAGLNALSDAANAA
ncbi:hypothetical protein AC249_AIPGENE8631 [Exaiptasia diaphana]|nr:hypothetical protein AC249_AIPGENE8631 [Exaiptasia diaphana]